MTTREEIENLKKRISSMEQERYAHLEEADQLESAIRLDEYELKELYKKSRIYTVKIEANVSQEVEALDKEEATAKAIEAFLEQKPFTIHVEKA